MEFIKKSFEDEDIDQTCDKEPKETPDGGFSEDDPLDKRSNLVEKILLKRPPKLKTVWIKWEKLQKIPFNILQEIASSDSESKKCLSLEYIVLSNQ